MKKTKSMAMADAKRKETMSKPTDAMMMTAKTAKRAKPKDKRKGSY